MSRGKRQIPMRQQRKIRKERNKRPAASCKANVTHCTALHCTRTDGWTMDEEKDGRTDRCCNNVSEEGKRDRRNIHQSRSSRGKDCDHSFLSTTDRPSDRPTGIHTKQLPLVSLHTHSCLCQLIKRKKTEF